MRRHGEGYRFGPVRCPCHYYFQDYYFIIMVITVVLGVSTAVAILLLVFIDIFALDLFSSLFFLLTVLLVPSYCYYHHGCHDYEYYDHVPCYYCYPSCCHCDAYDEEV